LEDLEIPVGRSDEVEIMVGIEFAFVVDDVGFSIDVRDE